MAVPRVEPWPTVGAEVVADESIFTLERVVRRSPTTGLEHPYLRLRAPDWVNVVALTTAGELVLVEQFRHGTGRVTLEIPGGAVDPGESAAAAALRELEEETGYRPRGEPFVIGVVEPNPAFLDNRCSTVLALDCEPDGTPDPDPGEEVRLRLEPLCRFAALIDEGAVTHALVVVAHDHLRRGLRRGDTWAEGLAALL